MLKEYLKQGRHDKFYGERITNRKLPIGKGMQEPPYNLFHQRQKIDLNHETAANVCLCSAKVRSCLHH